MKNRKELSADYWELLVVLLASGFHQISCSHRSISTRTSGRWPSGRRLCWAPIGRHCGGRPPSWAARGTASTSWRNASDRFICRDSVETLILSGASNISSSLDDNLMKIVRIGPQAVQVIQWSLDSNQLSTNCRSPVPDFASCPILIFTSTGRAKFFKTKLPMVMFCLSKNVSS